MKGELLKELLRAVGSDDPNLMDRAIASIIQDERNKGHQLLAKQLENIVRKDERHSRLKKKSSENANSAVSEQEGRELNQLPIVREQNASVGVLIPRKELRHHLVLSQEINNRFEKIEREYALRDRLAHHGLFNSKKIRRC